MFLFFLFFSCDTEVPSLEFENTGAGQVWQGGKNVETESSNQDETTLEDTAQNQDTSENVATDSGIESME